MRWLLILLVALMPSVILADNSTEKTIPSVADPCVKENGRSPIMDYEMTAPFSLIAYTKDVDTRDGYKRDPDPCAVNSKTKSEEREEHKSGDPWEDNPYLRLFPN
jgi:hypothetical protein